MIDVETWRSPPKKFTVAHMTTGNDPSDLTAIRAEERRLYCLRRAMDVTAALLKSIELTLEEAQDVVNHAKNTALQLFPDKESTFDLIYAPRFRRILSEKFNLH